MEPSRPSPHAAPLQLLSVVIPARDEANCIASTVEHLDLELRLHKIPHEIVVVDDGSTGSTWAILTDLKRRLPALNLTILTGTMGRMALGGPSSTGWTIHAATLLSS